MKKPDQLKHEQQIKKQLDDPETFDFPVTVLPDPPSPLDELASQYFYQAASFLIERGRLTVIGVYYLATVCRLITEVEQQPDFFSKEHARKRGMNISDEWPDELFEKIGRDERLKLVEKYLSWMGVGVNWIEKCGIQLRKIILNGANEESSSI